MENEIIIGKNYIQVSERICLFKHMIEHITMLKLVQSEIDNSKYYISLCFSKPINDSDKELFIKTIETEASANLYITMLLNAIDTILN